MTDVNPELVSATSDRERVKALFGSAPDVILKAVGKFIKRQPGELDHHGLRIVAAAAPHIADPKLVAELIDALPVTQMFIATAASDLEKARSDFAQILPRLRPKTRQRLVADLVRVSTLELLEFSPPERLTGAAKQIIENHLLRLAEGNQVDQARALSSAVASRRVVEKVLEVVEGRIERSERGTEGRPPGKVPLRLVADSLASVFDRDTACATPRDVERAWRLVERCEPDKTGLEVIIWSVVKSSKLSEPVAHAVLDVIGHLDPSKQGVLRGQMVAIPEMPEAAAMRAVKMGVDGVKGPALVDPRWYALRRHQYSRHGATVLPTEAADELDRRLTALPPDRLSQWVVARMTDPDALRVLSAKAGDLSDEAFFELVDNEHTPADVSIGAVKPRRTFREVLRSNRSVGDRERAVLVDPRKSDEELATLVGSVTDRERRDALLAVAIRNRSAGEQILELLLDKPVFSSHDAFCLMMLAETTPSADMHERLAALADRFLTPTYSSSGAVIPDPSRESLGLMIKKGLASNGMLDSRVPVDTSDVEVQQYMERARHTTGPFLRGIISVSPSIRSNVGAAPGSNALGYGPAEVADKVVAGLAPPNRVDAVVLAARDRVPQDRELMEAVTLLADNGHLQPVHWWTLTNRPDRHVAMRFATHPRCPASDSAVSPVAYAEMSSVAIAMSRGVQPPPDSKLKAWSDLPDLVDAPFKLSKVAELVDGQVVEGRRLRVIRTPRVLSDTAKYMGNCLKSYENDLDKGAHVLATAGEGNEMLALAWEVAYTPSGERSVKLRQINSRFNKGVVPERFRTGVEMMTAEIEAGRLQPAMVMEPVMEPEVSKSDSPARHSVALTESSSGPAHVDRVGPAVENHIDRASNASRQRPPGRRRALDLASGGSASEVSERGVQTHDSPSLLSRPEAAIADVDDVGVDARHREVVVASDELPGPDDVSIYGSPAL